MKKIVESYKRRLATEDGWVLKRGSRLRIALCYPNVYSIGMANLGFQAMYELFNNIPEVSCERVFLPDAGISPSVSEGSTSTRALPDVRASAPPHARKRTLAHGRASDIEFSRNSSGYELPRSRARIAFNE